jgi:serine/threonine protein kinase
MNWKLNAFKDYPLRHPRKGTCSNIFQIGCVMNCLLLGQKRHFNIDDTTLHKSKLNDDLRGQWHHAIDLETRFISELYSSDLRALVTECLLRESLNRPSSVELVNRCQAGKAAADKVSRDTNRPHGHIPEKLKTMRLIPLKPPEPPEDWLNDINHFESDIDEQTWRNYTTLPQARISSPTIFRKAAGELVRVASSLTSINSPPATPSKSLFRQGLGTFRRGLQSPPSSLSNPADADGPDDGEFLDITKDETSPPDS